MKHLNPRLVLSILALAVFPFAASNAAETWQFTILPDLELKDAPIHDAIEKIVDAAREAGAHELGFVGVKVELPPEKMRKPITMRLHDVPLIIALGYLAWNSLGEAIAVDGTVVIRPFLDRKTIGIVLTPVFKGELELKEKVSEEDLRNALTRCGFRVKRDTIIKISGDSKHARITLRPDDAMYLSSLAALIERGLKLHKEHGRCQAEKIE